MCGVWTSVKSLMSTVFRHCYGIQSSNAATFTWKLLVLDIRPRQQFEAGCLPLAINLDLNEPDRRKRIVDLTASACAAPRNPSSGAAAAAARTRSNNSGGPIISHYGFEDASEDAGTANAIKRREKLHQQPLTYHICVMSGDGSESQTRLSSYVYNILAQELFLK